MVEGKLMLLCGDRLLTDADYVKGDLWAGVETMFGYGCLMYSTHSHSP